MRKDKVKLVSVIITISLLPNIVFAAWWNPFSWKIFSKTPKAQVQEVQIVSTSQATSTDSALEVERLKNEVAELKKKTTPPVEKKIVVPPETAQKKDLKVITLPNGAIVETDVNGNVIRYIKEAPYIQNVNTNQASPQSNTTAEDVQITSINIALAITSVKIEWQTSKPTESKIFLSGDILSSKVYASESGLSTRHSAYIKGLKGDTSYSYEIEAITGGNSYKKMGSFVTQSPPPPTFDIETFTIPSYPNHFFMRVNSANGNFEFRAMTLEIDNPYGNTPGSSQSTNVGSIMNQTSVRTSGYMTCSGARNAYESWNKGSYPYPCPGSNDPEADNPGYLTSMNPRPNGDSASIPIHPDIPYPNGTRIYYYNVVDKTTGKIFEHKKR